MTRKPDPFTVPFGTILCDWMTTARADGGPFVYDGSPELYGDFTISPAAHVLHYGSAIFEGLKAYRQTDGSLAVFRLDRHVARMVTSAALLRLPEIDPVTLRQMIIDGVEANAGGGSRPARVAVRPPDADRHGGRHRRGGPPNPLRAAVCRELPGGRLLQGRDSAAHAAGGDVAATYRAPVRDGEVRRELRDGPGRHAGRDGPPTRQSIRCCSPPAATSPRPEPRTSSSPTTNGSSPAISTRRSYTASPATR